MNDIKLDKLLHDTLDFSIYIVKNEIPNPILFSEVKTNIDQQKVKYLVALLMRSCPKAHAINTMIQNELYEEAEILLRVLLEIRFIFKALYLDNNFINIYKNTLLIEGVKRLKSTKNAIKYGVPSSISINEISEQIKKLELKLSKKNKKLQIFEIAEKAKLLPIYYSSYTILCSSIHSGSFDLKDYFSYEDESQLTILRPKKKMRSIIQFTAIECMLDILETFDLILMLDSKKIDELRLSYEMLKDELNKKFLFESKPN